MWGWTWPAWGWGEPRAGPAALTPGCPAQMGGACFPPPCPSSHTAPSSASRSLRCFHLCPFSASPALSTHGGSRAAPLSSLPHVRPQGLTPHGSRFGVQPAPSAPACPCQSPAGPRGGCWGTHDEDVGPALQKAVLIPRAWLGDKDKPWQLLAAGKRQWVLTQTPCDAARLLLPCSTHSEVRKVAGTSSAHPARAPPAAEASGGSQGCCPCASTSPAPVPTDPPSPLPATSSFYFAPK